MKNRNVTFDIMKDIAILLVIIGHASETPQWLRIGIYSFHMPLFFVISGYFFHCKPFDQMVMSSAKRLLLPYTFTFVIMMCYTLLAFSINNNISYLLSALSCVLFPTNLRYHGIGIASPLWFLLALFWCRIIFNKLINIGDVSRDILIFFMGWIFSIFPMLRTFPLAVMQGISALVFFNMGYVLKQHEMKNNLKIFALILVGVWGYALFNSRIDMMNLRYDNFLIDILGALGGIYIIYLLSKNIVCKFNLLKRLFAYIGRYSLVVLCAHAVLRYVGFRKYLPFQDTYFGTVIEIILCVASISLVYRIPYCRKVFSLSNTK